MRKFFIYGLLAVSPVVVQSCSDDEEILEPSAAYVDNKFMVPDDVTGPEADLRREFYSSTGVYLMFDDLLSREYKGVDEFGQDVWQEERIDFNYDLTSYSTDPPRFEFIDSQEEKESAASLVKTQILSRIEGGKLAPFSVLLVKNMQTYQTKKYPYGYADAYTTSCWRCLAIAVDELAVAEGAERDAIIVKILKDIVSAKLFVGSAETKDFYVLSMEYSGMYLDEVFDDWDDNSDITRVYEIGFLSYTQGWWSDYLPYTDEDFDAYLDAVLEMSEEEFMEKYGDYPLIVTKYNVVKDGLTLLGYKF